MIAKSKEHVTQLVEEYVRRNATPDRSLRVMSAEARLADSAEEWWWIPVAFDGDPHKRYAFSMLLADIEEQLEENEHLNVALLPHPIVSPNEAS